VEGEALSIHGRRAFSLLFSVYGGSAMDESSTTPYVFDSPITTRELFFGRDAIFRSIKEALIDREQDNLIILCGQRRIGKTSVLHQIGHRLSEQYISVLIDLQGVPSDSPEGFLQKVASIIQQALQRDRGVQVALPSRDQFLADPQQAFDRDFLTRVEEALGDRYLILMFDEAQLIREKAQQDLWEGNAFEYLFNIIWQRASLGLILSIESEGTIIDQEFPSLSATGTQKKVGFLNRDDAVKLVVQPVQGTLTYDPEAVEHILFLTSGHPYYIQLLCHTLFAYCQRVNTRAVTLTDVEAILPEVVERAGSDSQFLWDNSTPEEKFVLAALAQAGGEKGQAVAKEELLTTLRRRRAPISARQVARALVNLSLREIINLQAPYVFNVDVFRLWLRDQKRIGWVKRELAGTVEQWKRERFKIPTGRRKLLWGIALAALLIGVVVAGGYLRGFIGQAETRVMEIMRTTPMAPISTPTLPLPVDTPTSGPIDNSTPVPTATVIIAPTATAAPMPTLSPTTTLTPMDASTPAAVSGLPGRGDVLDVAVAPSDGRWVYTTIKSKGIYRSTDGGLSWTLTALNGSGQDVLIDPADPRQIFVAVWAGVLRSTDGGATWDVSRRGLPKDQQVETLAWDPGDRRMMYAGLRANPLTGWAIYRSTDRGETWELLWSSAGGETLGNDVEALAIDPASGTRYVALSNAYDPRLDLEGGSCLPCAACELSLVGGEAWRVCRGGRDLVLDPVDPQVVYFARGAGTVRSTDGGETWWESTLSRQCLGEEVATAGSWALAIAPGDRQMLYEGTGYNSLTSQAGLYKTTDGGKTWQVINSGLPGWTGPCPSFLSTTIEHIYALAVDPADSQIVYAATSEGLYRTTDGGESWSKQ
jgi:photosystem II stability/assembly factor-like uncharacterized protein